MKRITLNLGVAILTFAIGTLTWVASPLRHVKSSSNQPLLVTVVESSTLEGLEHRSYLVTVKNVSDKTVRGYSIGHYCGCRAWDSNDNLYPDNLNFTNPVPEHQILRPGESQEIALDMATGDAHAWADLVHFEDGTNWGPNQGHKEGYVRE